jgi:hypothetical protein
MKKVMTALAGAVVLAQAGAAWAHHSYAMFDRSQSLKLTGAIEAFNWTNPHSSIEIMVKNAKGVPEKWGVECTSPSVLVHAGWKSNTLKPGDQVVITIHPLHSGELGGAFVSVQLPDGRVLTDKSSS